jgi:hypothetical protein
LLEKVKVVEDNPTQAPEQNPAYVSSYTTQINGELTVLLREAIKYKGPSVYAQDKEDSREDDAQRLSGLVPFLHRVVDGI